MCFGARRHSRLCRDRLAVKRNLEPWMDKTLGDITSDVVQKRQKVLSKESEASENKAMRTLERII